MPACHSIGWLCCPVVTTFIVLLYLKTCRVEIENGASQVTRCIGLLDHRYLGLYLHHFLAYCACGLSSMHLRMSHVIVYCTVTVQYLLYCSVTVQHNSQRDSHPLLCHTCPHLPPETSNAMESNRIGLRRKLSILCSRSRLHEIDGASVTICSQSQLVTTLNHLNLDWMKLIN